VGRRKRIHEDDEDMRAGAATPDVEADEEFAARPDPALDAPVIVIHPGSVQLRIGLADALGPRVIPHCIAYPKRLMHMTRTPDSELPMDVQGEAVATILESSLTPLARQLRLGIRHMGQEQPIAASEMYSALPSAAPSFIFGDHSNAKAVAPNASSAEQADGQCNATSSSEPNGDSSSESFLVGESALLAARREPERWHVVYPMSCGALNTHTGLSERTLYSAIEDIWRCTIYGGGGEPGLGLNPSTWPNPCAVLVLPDLFDRRMGAEILDVLLTPRGLGLRAAIVHEEAACASFGAGVGSACVVDIGSQRTSVCCIDEGMPMSGCRHILAYGVADMEVLLHVLCHRQQLTAMLPTPLAVAPSYTPTEATLNILRQLRQHCCSLHLHVNPRDSLVLSLSAITALPIGSTTYAAAPAANLASATDTALALASTAPAAAHTSRAAAVSAAILDHTFEADTAANPCRVHLGSLAPIPPLLLFSPAVALAMQQTLGFKRPKSYVSSGSQQNHSDVWDDEFLNESALERALPAGINPAAPKDIFVGAANFAPALTPLGACHLRGLTPDAQLSYTPLDEAIVRAVERGKSTEVKRRLYGTILLIGGGAHTEGLAHYLEWRIACCWKLAEDSAEGIERVEVVKLPAGTEPQALAWHGAALLPKLESGRTLWILNDEWLRRGALAAREVCAFPW